MPFGVDRPLPADFEVSAIATPKRRPSKCFGPNNPSKGKPKGAISKITRDLKQGLLEGAILHGYDGAGEDGLIGYCHHLAEQHPKVYGHLLGKLLPYNVNAEVAGAFVTAVNIVSIPSDKYLSLDAITQLQGTRQLEHAPQQDAPLLAKPTLEIEPQSSEEARLLAELNSLTHEQLMERAIACGLDPNLLSSSSSTNAD